ncbi:phosphatidylinositol transfer protein 1-like [Symsagittifera roscoffensis]|uniref:phosphatidylinositol transfer protein 1-like n=1 Tax=Symsagittifera roscoffensis TaxID=84072 RepID=UPI00307C62AD
MYYIEYVIALPFSLDQYRVGYLWSQLQFSKQETGGGSGVEFVEQRILTDPEPGKFTHRIYYLEKKFPKIVTSILPNKYFRVTEKSESFRNFTESKYSHDSISDEKFSITLTSTSAESHKQNIFNLTEEQLKSRKSIFVDITKCFDEKDYEESGDPTKFVSERLKFGPLRGSDWVRETDCPNVLYIHKMYSINVAMPGIGHAKPKIIETLTRMMYKFYRQMFCWTDEWLHYSMQDVEELERVVKIELKKLRSDKEARGISS